MPGCTNRAEKNFNMIKLVTTITILQHIQNPDIFNVWVLMESFMSGHVKSEWTKVLICFSY